MTRDEITGLAREAGIMPTVLNHWPNELGRFASLVAAAEREACACIAERAGYRSNGTPAYEHIATAIRARSQA